MVPGDDLHCRILAIPLETGQRRAPVTFLDANSRETFASSSSNLLQETDNMAPSDDCVHCRDLGEERERAHFLLRPNQTTDLVGSFAGVHTRKDLELASLTSLTSLRARRIQPRSEYKLSREQITAVTPSGDCTGCTELVAHWVARTRHQLKLLKAQNERV